MDSEQGNNERSIEYSLAERLLLPAALLIGVLFDRLVVARFMHIGLLAPSAAAFWLCCLAVFIGFNLKRLSRGRAHWIVAGCAAALCVWNFLYDRNGEFKLLTLLIIPAVLMAYAQFVAGGMSLKEAGRLTKAWFAGWFPFSGLPALAGVVGSLIAGGRRQTLKKILIGVTVTIPLLGVLVTLLAGADRVFGYWAETLLSGWNLPSLIRHLFITLAAGSLFYAFLWKMKFNKRDDPAPQGSGRIDVVICCIVLGAVSLLYLLYCGIQFTYLFARAGLPNGLTYSGYAREGFAQTVVVTAVNLILFGLFLRYGKSSKPVKALLAGLLGLTGVILVSGCVRLGLYIEAYGLTWLRFLSAWFIVYLAAVLVICAVRMFSEKLPAIALAALLLLCWTVALGYANPDRFVERYNEGHGALRDQLSPLDHNVKREYGVF